MFLDVSVITVEDTFNQTFKVILYSVTWVGTHVNRHRKESQWFKNDEIRSEIR